VGVILGIIAVVAAAAFAGKMVFSKKSAKTLDGTRLDMPSAVENANSLRGNEYVVEGRIDDQLRWDPDHGQVISLRVENGDRGEFLAIEIPPSLSNINIEREQDYAFRVRFREGGIAVAEEISRF
jgi:hypothetical protein